MRRTVEALQRLWEAMLGIYGHTWSSQYGISPVRADGELSQAGKAWAEAISGLKPSQIAAGVRAAHRSGNEFPPNAARFRVLALGLPSITEVENELAPGRDRSPFTVLVWSKLDQYRYGQADGRDQRRMLGSAYDLAVRHVQDGHPMPEPMKALGYQPIRAPEVSDRARARAAMERAQAELDAAFSQPPPADEEDAG
ncbi:hypothetical protein [[Pseudomonas] boreopolis]|uniref:Phage replication protein P n=1 Tax=Xanthomonas boreopolis TaxID=86183 RepID=A0A919F7I8_9XANT|nr:hypothetical protein GCM10009090_16350 [[Pseudomonas] boreopolis]